MKEYIYTNKSYLGIKEGIVPPAPQYLWLNSKDDKLYKFGDNGWEIINEDNNTLYVADFTINDLERLLYDDLESLEVNGKALLQALRDHKAIGLLWNNDSYSMSLASAYKDNYIYLSVIHMNELYRTSVNLPYNYDEVDESKSGIIYKGETTVYALDTYHEHFLDIDAGVVREAYLNNQEITCDYNSLRDAVEVDKYIRIAAETGGTVLVNAVFIYDSIALTYIIENTLWQITIYRSEDENGNVYGRAYGNEIAKIDLSDTKNGSRYIIQDFTIENIIDNETVTITHELVKAITYNRPLAIYYATGESDIYDITEVAADLDTRTYISLKVSYRGGCNLIIDSSNVVTEGGSIRASSHWKDDPDNTRLIANSSGDTIFPDDGVITVRPSFFADKSLDNIESNAQGGSFAIRQQITILERPLTENGQFVFLLPTMGTAVEYTIRFRVDTQCALKIISPLGELQNGLVFGGTLSNIPVGTYLMKITLYTYVNTNGIEQTDYFAEVITMTSK